MIKIMQKTIDFFLFFLDAFEKASRPENFKMLCSSSSPRQEYGFGDEDLLYVSI